MTEDELNELLDLLGPMDEAQRARAHEVIRRAYATGYEEGEQAGILQS